MVFCAQRTDSDIERWSPRSRVSGGWARSLAYRLIFARIADLGIRNSFSVFTQYAIVAADEAIAQAGLERGSVGGADCAVILGSGIGGIRTVDDGLFNLYARGQKPEPLSIPKLIASAGPSMLSIRYDAHGPVFAVASACSSSRS